MLHGVLHGWWSVFKRELTGYFRSPVGLVFIVIFLVLAGVFTFQQGNFFARRQADLAPFFQFHPWLYLFLVPAVSMRLWAEERRQGTIELLLTLPVSLAGAVVGKFLAAWAFCGIALAMTFPMWWTVAWLGNPDHGAIATAYLGSLLMAGGFLAVGSVLSATTKSQVVAFILTAVVCLALLLAGDSTVIGFLKGSAPTPVIEAVSGLSFLTRFESVSRGVLDVRDIVYFVTLIGASIVGTVLVLENMKGE